MLTFDVLAATMKEIYDTRFKTVHAVGVRFCMREVLSQERISAAAQGSEADLAAVFARYLPFIHRTARRFTGPGMDFDDAAQEGIIGLFSAIQNYRPDSSASFSTYSKACIQNAIIGAKRAANRKKHAPLNNSIPIPEQQSTPGPEDAAIEGEMARQALEKARMVLSFMEKRVLRLYLWGMDYRQIAARIGVNEKSVDNALVRIRRKLR